MSTKVTCNGFETKGPIDYAVQGGGRYLRWDNFEQLLLETHFSRGHLFQREGGGATNRQYYATGNLIASFSDTASYMYILN